MNQPMATGLFVVLLVATASTAIAVVFNKHHTRQLFVETRELAAQIDGYSEQWSQLQLEYGTQASQARVERYAREKLNMDVPAFTDIRIVR